MRKELEIHIGDSLDDIGARAVDAWHRMERGQAVNERHVSFEDWETFASVMTPKRIELLRHVHGKPARSIRALATALRRDYRRVHDDVKALVRAGLLDEDESGLTTSYDSFRAEARIAL